MVAEQNGTHTWLNWRYGHTMSCQIFSQSSWGNLQIPPPCPQMEVRHCRPVTKAISNHPPMEMVRELMFINLIYLVLFLPLEYRLQKMSHTFEHVRAQHFGLIIFVFCFIFSFNLRHKRTKKIKNI